jgi:hypothetical protein
MRRLLLVPSAMFCLSCDSTAPAELDVVLASKPLPMPTCTGSGYEYGTWVAKEDVLAATTLWACSPAEGLGTCYLAQDRDEGQNKTIYFASSLDGGWTGSAWARAAFVEDRKGPHWYTPPFFSSGATGTFNFTRNVQGPWTYDKLAKVVGWEVCFDAPPG